MSRPPRRAVAWWWCASAGFDKLVHMHVLLAIGDDAKRAAVRDALTAAGHEVTAVADADAAATLLERVRPELYLAESPRAESARGDSAALQHEINNPLAALLAHASLLEQGLHEPGEERELLAVIVEQAHRIADVVKRIAARRDPEGPEFVPRED